MSLHLVRSVRPLRARQRQRVFAFVERQRRQDRAFKRAIVAVTILAVLALFVVVRNNIEAPGGLKRLSIVAFSNGVLLSLVGLLQFFSSSHNVVYWSIPTRGTVFGGVVWHVTRAFLTMPKWSMYF